MRMRASALRVLVGGGALGFLVAVVACGDSDPASPNDLTKVDFAPALGVNLAAMTETPSGLYYQDLVAGSGEEAVSGGTVTVHYTGWLSDGTQFDSSLGGDPVTFSLTQVISGWQEGIPGMRVGGKRKLVIPPKLGYGRDGVPGAIPGNAVLVFDVELLGVG
jgi:FKBP-type peptidyl-prolyl cis-trans isomerase